MSGKDFLSEEIDVLSIEGEHPKTISLEDNIDKRCLDNLDIASKKYDGALVRRPIENVEHKIFNEQLRKTINSRLSTLSEEQAFVLTHIYGLNNATPVSIERIASAMNIDKSVALEILKEAFNELRKSSEPLANFL